MTWTTLLSAVSTPFAASFVEAVEAFTILLAVKVTWGWRPACIGGMLALLVLAVVVSLAGPMLRLLPLQLLRLLIGLLLLIFGLGWLRKAILRAAGIIPLHDEQAVYAHTHADLILARQQQLAGLWLGGLTAFKAVFLEGLEVIFIIIAICANSQLWVPAVWGAVSACVLVGVLGVALSRPLSQIPENALKLGVGALVTAFGVFWTGEGLAITWPGQDGALIFLAVVFGLLSVFLAYLLRRRQVRMA